MAEQRDLTDASCLNEGNDEEVLANLTTNQPALATPLNLTGLVVEAYLKVNKATPDSDATTWKGTSAGGSPAVTITNPTAGAISIKIPASAVTTNKTVWKVDVLEGLLRKTALFGAVEVRDL